MCCVNKAPTGLWIIACAKKEKFILGFLGIKFFVLSWYHDFSFLYQVLNSETSKRPTSRSRMMPHAIGPQLTNKSSKSAPTVGDSSDGGPKEPPILVTPSESFRYPLDPCFVFLQLYHASFLGTVNERPQPLPDGEVSFSVFCKVVVWSR